MKTWSVLFVALCLTVGVVACTNGGTDPTESNAQTEAPAPVTEPAVAVTQTPAPAAVETPAPADAAAAPAAPTAGSLEGSTWKVGEFTVSFQPEGKVSLSGGDLQGIEGTWTVEGDQVTVSALGQSKTGTWDGATLLIDGEAAQKL